jgi:hypothetical protein
VRRSVERAWRLLAPLALLAADPAGAYGPQGHLIAGRIAASYLCREAVAAVGRLGDDEGLDEMGLWADRIRGDARYSQSGPWHYMNIADDAGIAAYVSPPEGDVLSALERFHGVLGDAAAAMPERADALRFLTHLVVDLHQPLHVGRAEDRGGNGIDIFVDGERINLHRLWDTEAITTVQLRLPVYARLIAEDVTPAMLAAPFEPRVWAAESLALRPQVYDFPGDGAIADAAYMESVRRITRERLTLAAARLAATLNGLFCQ